MVTIAIPFYNAEKFLAKSIDSVLYQTYSEWTLLLIDDGSTDSSLQIAKQYALNDRRIKVHSDGMNKNLGYRLNEIPFLTGTEYLVRMDADDIMHPERIEKQLNVLLENDNIDVLGSNAYSIDENDMVFGIRLDHSGDKLIKVKAFIHPTIMAKTMWFRANPYDVNAIRIEDTELWFRSRNKFNFYCLTEPLLFYREVGSAYYKKYFLANASKKYILKKYQNDFFWKNFFRQNQVKGILYKILDLVSLEKFLINRRNMVKFANKEHYEKFIS